MPINTGPSRSFARGRRRGRSPRRFAPNNPITPPTSNQPVQAQAPGLQPATGTTTAAGSSMPQDPANNPINVSMPSSSTPAGAINTQPSTMSSTPIGSSSPGTPGGQIPYGGAIGPSGPVGNTGGSGIQAPGSTRIDQFPGGQQAPPNQQVGPNTPMQVQMPATGATSQTGVNTNPSPKANMYQSTPSPKAGVDPWQAGMNWAKQRNMAMSQQYKGHTTNYNPSADSGNTAYWDAMKEKYGADNPYAQAGDRKPLLGQQAGYTFGGPGW